MSKNWFKNIVVGALVACFAAGCTLKISPVDPKPNVSLPTVNKTLALALDTSIQDTFTIPSGNGIRGAEVTGWTQSLKAGFKNAFSDSFKVVDDKSVADLILTIKRADITLAPTSVKVNKYGDTLGAASLRTQIVYSAKLAGKGGDEFGRSANTAISKRSITSPGEISNSASEAIESMYEIIAEEIFKGTK